jgi:hypothetical protein
MAALPFKIGADLTIQLGAEALRLTPSQGLRAAERLVRRSLIQMMREEAGLSRPLRRPRPTASRRRASVN